MNSTYGYSSILSRRGRIIKKKEMRHREEFDKALHDIVEELKKDVDSRVCRTIGYLRSKKDGDWWV